MALDHTASTRERLTLRGLPVTIRVLLSCFLVTIGLGYLFALTYLFLLDIEPHRKMGMGLVQSTILKYYGSRGGTRLEAALQGSMAGKIDPAEKDEVIHWIRGGATAEGYEKIRPVLEKNCIVCHSQDSGYPIPPFTSYDEIRAVVEMDLGTSIRTLARVSHVHLFGISIIFLLSGSIFALGEINKRLRLAIVALPFISIWLDVGSWWFTKYEPIFAYTVVIGGTLMGLALAAQIFISLWEMWLKNPRPKEPM